MINFINFSTENHLLSLFFRVRMEPHFPLKSLITYFHVNKTDFDSKLTSFNRWVTSNKTKHLEVQKKLNILITKYYNFFIGRIYFTSNDGSQNRFVYQSKISMLELKKEKGTEYITGCKSKGVYNSKLKASHGAFLTNVRYFGNKTGIQFNSTPLIIEQNNYVTEIVNVYIVYDLDD